MQITAIIAGLRDTYKYFALSFFAYLVLYCLLMPDMVITHMDDFGYYEGLVRTLKTGRIQTGECSERTYLQGFREFLCKHIRRPGILFNIKFHAALCASIETVYAGRCISNILPVLYAPGVFD
jgi:hypothetical protein